MYQAETRPRNQVVLSFADGRSGSAMHFHKTGETGLSQCVPPQVVALDLVTKHCCLTEEKPKFQTTKDTCLKRHIAAIEI